MNNLFERVDISAAFNKIEGALKVEYRNPMIAPYADPERVTASQVKAWEFLHARSGTGPLIAMLGGKGSGKTHFGGCFAAHQTQTYPESLGCIISNTYTQAKDNAGALLMKLMKAIDRPVEFFTAKKIKGKPFSSVFVVDLDDTGFESGKCAYILLRSFDAVNKLEGIELDWLWVEEIQDSDKEAFITVFSRVRGQGADNAIFIAGMPEDEFHWQYRVLPQLGFVEEANFDAQLHNGVMFEPSLRENIKNVGQKYLDRLMAAYDEELATRYIEGKRSSMRGNKVLYQYTDHAHRTGRMSALLCKYDRNLPIYFSIDFNVSPMSISAYQIKGWNDVWDSPSIVFVDNGVRQYRDPKLMEKGEWDDFASIEDIAVADREILAQIDEFEVWSGGTQAACEQIVSRYADHVAGVTVIGDATGNRQDTRSSTTDWQIIRKNFAKMHEVVVIQGLLQQSNLKTGEVTYSNPPRRDTINIANRLLRDAMGRVHVCLLPKSEFKSGGVARSVASAKNKPDGNIDDSNDKKEGRDLPRLHFFDTFRYICFWHNGGTIGMTGEEFDEYAGDLSKTAAISSREFGVGTFSS
jgi:hypothetical protein